ncbi:uncharacterized protein EV420DRAFT_1645129 [Desarmillaria tabescens]|uniref:Uncharacterized protein n=1 Tax=Armillaria tabescens TaxID=1929756 RepID=A0AA39N1Z3_ARMTA|nr:uncharacterized protein EV420DRAFT_1645129 [Desarmillaria tabescens]KAK0454235.1 hypothetical protein EV420DRAFT_1645129 [Desarmillaria tabescens]
MAAPDVLLQILENAYHANTTSKTTLINPLPQELMNAIIDEIYNYLDPKSTQHALKACALASSIFVCRTRKHLFGHITIWLIPDYEKLLPLSQVHSFTTSLTIIFQSRLCGRYYPTISTLTGLPSLVDALHNVNTIMLCGMNWKSISQRFIDSLALRSFISITLMHTHFPDSNTFYSFLSHSSNLCQFSCFMTTVDSSDRPPFHTSHRPHIIELSLQKMSQIPAMLLSHALSPVNLQSLRILDVFLDDAG